MTTLVPHLRRSFLPWAETEGFENRLNKLFDEPFMTPTFTTAEWLPTVDVAETDDALLLTAEMPGLTEEDVEIELEGNVLTLRGEKKEEYEKEEEKGERRMRIWERRYGKFARSFTVPNTVDAEKIEAEFENGILKIHLPKTLEAKGRRILINKK